MTHLRMPALFIGHGSPMNVLEDNRYTQAWRKLGDTLPRPKAILAVSAHWYTRGTAVTAMENPKTIHDFGGFPDALYQQVYPALGSPALAKRITEQLAPLEVIQDHDDWGLDHGTWGVLIKMYPDADIPVVQLSIDGTQPAAFHYELGKKLAELRDEGVMIVASGNVVHNLRKIKWQGETSPYSWATSFEQFVKENLTYGGPDHPLVNFMAQEGAIEACPTPEHYLPLLYVLGAWNGSEPISVPVDGIESGSLSMLTVQIG